MAESLVEASGPEERARILTSCNNIEFSTHKNGHGFKNGKRREAGIV